MEGRPRLGEDGWMARDGAYIIHEGAVYAMHARTHGAPPFQFGKLSIDPGNAQLATAKWQPF